MENWDLRRARHALQQVQQPHLSIDSEFAGTAKRLPMMIRTCGLAQAAAFYCGKGGSHEHIISACRLWLIQSNTLPASQRSLAEMVVDETVSNAQVLRRCTSEVLAYLFWYIRFVDARKR